MTDYVIGDLQGCFTEFERLLNKVDFTPGKDKLYLVGDIVARGPDSLACLRFLYKHASSVFITLGNHDLHLIASYHLKLKPNPLDKLADLFSAKDCPELINFLQNQPLAIWLEEYNTLICHAGLTPHWDLTTAINNAKATEKKYQGDNALYYFKNMYGDGPKKWCNQLSEIEKFRYTINAFTRMRFFTPDGSMDLIHKTAPQDNPDLIPWYKLKTKLPDKNIQIIFGHWASLQGAVPQENIKALDTGCVWGGKMTMLNLATGQLIHEPANAIRSQY